MWERRWAACIKQAAQRDLCPSFSISSSPISFRGWWAVFRVRAFDVADVLERNGLITDTDTVATGGNDRSAGQSGLHISGRPSPVTHELQLEAQDDVLAGL